MFRNRLLKALVLVGLTLTLGAASAMASLYYVTVDTSALSGTYGFYASLTDGGTPGTGNVALSLFNFGGGAASGSATNSGGGSGDLSAGFTLSDSANFFSDVSQSFTAGSQLGFLLALPDVADSPTPDHLSIFLLDPAHGAIFSTGNPNFAGMIEVDLGSAPVANFTFNGEDARLQAPTVQVVPEPASMLLVGSGLLGFLKRRKK